MVVFYHCDGIFSLSKYWHWTGRHYFHFGASGVGFFFVLSGIVILHAHWSDIGRKCRLGNYAWKRFKRIFPIYWVVLIAVLPLYFIIPSFGSGIEKQPGVILDSFLLIPITQIATIVPVAWTLFHEVMFYAIFSVLLIRRNVGVVVLVAWMLASLSTLISPPHSQLLGIYTSPLHLLFGLGLLVLVLVRHTSLPGLPFALLGVLGFVACCVVDDLRVPDTHYFYLMLIYGLCSALAVMGFMLLEKRGKLRISQLLIFLGDSSYSLYLVHYMVLSATAKVVYSLWLRHPVPLAIPFVALIFAALSGGIAVHLFVERPLLRRLSKVA